MNIVLRTIKKHGAFEREIQVFSTVSRIYFDIDTFLIDMVLWSDQ